MQTSRAINKNVGGNDSEKYLSKLCERTFLSLWSYPNVYTDEGKKTASGDGKELCDLLVVFENHVIIFSDKDISFKDSGDLKVDWGRWVKRAVIKSAVQLYGAESSLKERPGRLFLDAKCNVPFPIKVPKCDEIIVHRIAVAKNASKKFQEHSGGSGSLIICPRIVGNQHFDTPFMIGQPIADKPYVHVFDDIALDIILSELDTIADFIDYLSKKEEFIASGGLNSAAGEEELLAWYYINAKDGREPGFYIEKGVSALIVEGAYESLKNLPQFIRGKELNSNSYFWDACIENFAKHMLSGTILSEGDFSFDEMTRGLRIMASETRFSRRILSNAIIEKVTSIPHGQRGVRVLVSPSNSDNGYVWLVVPVPECCTSYDDYRKYRKDTLSVYCASAKLLFPDMKYIVGVATEPMGGNGGEDMVFIDSTQWTEDDYERARKDRDEFKALLPDNIKRTDDHDYQFPILPGDYPEKETLRVEKNSKARLKRIKKAQKKARRNNRK
ncbi:hypothetical protein [Enterobacter cloacae]|nr:hypothetical protein [Enterobacter cloacae]WGL84231.1 hypothetical protein QFB83_10715 [Enterobacter cloacae]